MSFRTRDELYQLSKSELVLLVESLQESIELGVKNQPSRRRNNRSKFIDINKDELVKIHLTGKSISEIAEMINNYLSSKNDNRRITPAGVLYKIRLYESENNVKVYKPARAGRKPKGV